jgi:hypothetical protein
LINLREDDSIASVARVEITEIEEVISESSGEPEDNDAENNQINDNQSEDNQIEGSLN